VGRALPAVLLTSFVMGLTLIVVTRIGAVQLGTLASGAAGVTTITLYSRLSRFGKNADGAETQQEGESSSRHAMGLFTAAFPYIFLVVVVSLSQIPALKSALAGYRLAFAFPASSTALGFEVAPVTDYAAIRLFAHPAPFLAAAAILGALIYRRKTTFDLSTVRAVARDSYKQCWNATLSIGLMVMMALVMNDSGMTSVLASGVANFSGRFFPLFSPLVGVLGSFMTGSNTNSNVLFGAFQEQVALQLGVSAAILAAAQSVGGSLGSAIAPAKAIIGAATVGIAGQEGAILKNTLLYCLLNAAIVGIIVFLVV
ncbi:MAG: L-lactate permease, partial [Spirochaeta sp.]|nr:L-lactate permease [Spirochaeta sp.]